MVTAHAVAAKPALYSNTFGGENSNVNITVSKPDSYRFEYAVFKSPNFNAWEDRKGEDVKGEYFATLPKGYVCVSYGISGVSLCTPNGDDRGRCPEGQFRNSQTGNCELPRRVPRPCPEGLARNSVTGNCENPPCPRGQFRSSSTGRCERPPCPDGKVRDPESGACKSRPCPKGQFRNSGTGECDYPPCPLGQSRDRDTGVCQFPACPEGQVRGPTGFCQDPCPETQVWNLDLGSCGCAKGEQLNAERGKCQRRVVKDAWVDADKVDQYVQDTKNIISKHDANGSVALIGGNNGEVIKRTVINY